MSSEKSFIPQIETMDLRSLYDQLFIVAVSTGPRNDGRLLAKTIHGPFDFDEMIGEVGRMWNEDQNNAKVYILDKDVRKKPRWLDCDTIDYIQLKYVDIVMDRILAKEENFTCEAGIREEETKTQIREDDES